MILHFHGFPQLTFAPGGKFEFTRQDFDKDHDAEIRKVLSQMERRSPDELEDQVYRSFRYDLCPACHKRFLRNPYRELRP